MENGVHFFDAADGGAVAFFGIVGGDDGFAFVEGVEFVIEDGGVVFGDFSFGGPGVFGLVDQVFVASKAVEGHELDGSFGVRHGVLL